MAGLRLMFSACRKSTANRCADRRSARLSHSANSLLEHRMLTTTASTTGPDGHGVADVHNLVTLSRLPLLATREVRHSLVPPLQHSVQTAEPADTDYKPLRFDRAVLVTDFHVGSGRRLSVVNLHLRAPLAATIAGQKLAPLVWKSVSAVGRGLLPGSEFASEHLSLLALTSRVGASAPDEVRSRLRHRKCLPLERCGCERALRWIRSRVERRAQDTCRHPPRAAHRPAAPRALLDAGSRGGRNSWPIDRDRRPAPSSGAGRRSSRPRARATTLSSTMRCARAIRSTACCRLRRRAHPKWTSAGQALVPAAGAHGRVPGQISGRTRELRRRAGPRARRH